METLTKKPPSGRVGRVISATLLYAMLIVFAAIVLIPLGWVLLGSLKSQSDFADLSAWALPTQLQWVNYANAWVDAKMGQYFLNTVMITLMALVINIVVSVPCAYALSRFKFRFRGVLAALMMAGLFINVNYIVVPIFSRVFSALDAMGVSGFITNPITIALIYASTSIAFPVYLMQGFFRTLSPSFEEAAKIDGCGYFGIMVRIIVPLAMPSILIVLLFNFLKFWNEYLLADIFLRGDKGALTLSLGVMELMSVARLSDDKGRMFAGLTIVMIPTLIFYAAVQDQLSKGITIGGGKE